MRRNIFKELMVGVDAIKQHRNRNSKVTLRNYPVKASSIPAIDSSFIRETRERLRCSQAVFARQLRINERTLEKWEQGRAKPNPQAVTLMLLVRNYPDTIARLEALPDLSCSA